MAKPKRSGVSLPLIGIILIIGVFFFGGLVYLLSPKDLRPPLIQTFAEGITLNYGTTEDGHPFLGNEDAPVTVYEFADFQCPHCKQHHDVFAREVVKTFIEPGKAKLVWITFPFMGDGSADDESVLASMAGYCALDQGKFNRERIRLIAERMGLDVAAWDRCIDDPATRAKTDADKAFAREKGIESTPSFLVGDTVIDGTGQQKMADLAAAIDTPSQ